jgi:hypothetical protein
VKKVALARSRMTSPSIFGWRSKQRSSSHDTADQPPS